MSSLVRVVSVLYRGSARLCFALGCVGGEGLTMSLLVCVMMAGGCCAGGVHGYCAGWCYGT